MRLVHCPSLTAECHKSQGWTKQDSPSSSLVAGLEATAHSAFSSSSVFAASTSIQLTSVPSSSVAVEICFEHRQESSTMNFNLY